MKAAKLVVMALVMFATHSASAMNKEWGQASAPCPYMKSGTLLDSSSDPLIMPPLNAKDYKTKLAPRTARTSSRDRIR